MHCNSLAGRYQERLARAAFSKTAVCMKLLSRPGLRISYIATSSDALTSRTTSQRVSATHAATSPRGNVLGTSTATQSIIERVVEGGITQEQLTAALNGLSDQFNQRLASLPAPVISFSGPAATTPVNTATFAPSQRIDQLANVFITNATVNGVAGLTDDDLPDSLTASGYLPLSGGALSGDLSLTEFTPPVENASAFVAGR